MGYLYSHQFNEFGEDHYYAMPERAPGDESWNAPVAHVTVTQHEEHPLIRPNAKPVEWYSPEQNRDYSLGVDKLKDTYGEDSPRVKEQRERPQMFQSDPEHISGVSRNPAVSPAALGTLLGIALSKHPNVKADSTLTAAGSRLAKKGIAAGAVTATDRNPSASPNYSDYTPLTILGRSDEGGHVWDTTPLSSEDVEAGRQTMRNLIRGNKAQEPTPKPMGPQFTQPKLPGMD